MVASVGTEGSPVIARAWGRGIWEMLFSGHRVPVWGGEEVLGREGGDGCTAMQMCLMPLSCTLKNG